MKIDKRERTEKHLAIVSSIINGESVETLSEKYGMVRKSIEWVCYKYGISLHGKWSSRKPPRKIGMGDTELVEWLKSKCTRSESGCLLWDGPTSGGGYGTCSKNNKSFLIHRFIFEVFHKIKLPKEIQVCHSCDVRNCISIDHLFRGTALENTRDKINKGRGVVLRGEQLPHTRLKKDQVIEIKSMLKKSVSLSSIASMFGVHIQTVAAIKQGRNWKHVVLK